MVQSKQESLGVIFLLPLSNINEGFDKKISPFSVKKLHKNAFLNQRNQKVN